jgi:hypothetical protein
LLGLSANVTRVAAAETCRHLLRQRKIASVLTFDLIDPMDALSLFRCQYFLNTDLVNQMLSAQVRKMRPFFVIGQIFANAVDHHHYESAIVHIEPIGTAHELIGAISRKGTVNIFAKVWSVKARHAA